MIEKGGSFSYRERFDTAPSSMRPRSPPAWAGRREGSFHGHEGEVVTLTRGCISPSPQPSPVKGEGEEPPSQSSPPNGGRRGSPCPSAPLDSGPVSSTGQALRQAQDQAPGPLPSRARHRERDKEGGFQTRPYRRERLSASNIAYRRADTWVRPYGWAREHPPHPIPFPRRRGRVSNPPLQEPRYAVSGRTRGVTLTPALSRRVRGGKSPLPRSLFSCVVGLGFIRGVSGRGAWSRWARHRGPARASAVLVFP